jgi:Methylase involved in ubiquinone/menaquinone biosynthesis
MNESEYKLFYNRIGKINGWDFSQVKCISEGPHLNFSDEVIKECKKSDLVLDIGTGGGESILPVADSITLLAGIDRSEEMVIAATENGRQLGHTNARFLQMDAEKLEFPADFFDVITCRHSAFSPREVARVLTKDGIFITQQVSENDKFNLKEAFGRGQAWGIEAGSLKQQYLAELRAAGFTDIQLFDFNNKEFYQTAEDLIFLLTHTPIIPSFGESEHDYRILYSFISKYQTPKGIETNSARFVIKARL